MSNEQLPEDVNETAEETVASPTRPTVTQTAKVSGPLDPNMPFWVPIPADTYTAIRDMIENRWPNINIEEYAGRRDVYNTVIAGLDTSVRGDVFTSTVSDTEADFHQGVLIDAESGKYIRAGKPRHRDTGGKLLVGEKAMARVREITHSGGLIQIPLWHSGFWVSLRKPSIEALMELEYLISQEKIQLGRQTNGAVFGNSTVFMSKHLVEFVLEHLHSTSLIEKESITDLMSALDLESVAWGMAVAAFPNGFNYARSVLDDDPDKSYVIREKLDLTKIQWVNNAALTEWQIGHMGNRNQATVTTDSVKRYQSEFTKGMPREVKLIGDEETGEISVKLKVPNISEYINAGTTWINTIVATTDKALAADVNDRVRNNYINKLAAATYMRLYAHWVAAVIIDGEEITDRETIDKTLNELSPNGTIRQKYNEEIIKFINESTIAVIAVTTETVAEAEANTTLPAFPHLLPIDAVSTFFILVALTSQVLTSQAENL